MGHTCDMVTSFIITVTSHIYVRSACVWSFFYLLSVELSYISKNSGNFNPVRDMNKQSFYRKQMSRQPFKPLVVFSIM